MRNIIVWSFLFIMVNFIYAEETAQDYFKSGQKAIVKRDYYKAADYFKKALIKNPYYKEAIAGAGEAYYLMGNYLESKKFYDKALVYDPENIEYLLKLADIKIQTADEPKEYLGAEFYLLKAYKKEPRNEKVLMAYGDYYFQLGKLQEALEYYTKAMRSNPDFLVFIKMSRIYKKWGKMEKCYDYLIKAENLNSMDYRVTYELGKYFLEVKDLEHAGKYLEMTLKFYPEYREGLYETIKFYLLAEKYADAINKINDMLKLDPENPLLYYNMAICYDKLSRFEESVDFLLQGEKFDYSDEILRIKAEEITAKNLPLGHTIRAKLAQIYLKNGEIAYQKDQVVHAILYFKRGLRVNPLSVEIRKKLADIYRERGWVDLYLRTLKAGLFVDKNNQDLKDLISLNEKFMWNTLSYEKKIDQYDVPSFLPVVYIGDVITDSDNRHFDFNREVKELVMDGLYNIYSVNVKELTGDEIYKVSKKSNLLLRVNFYEDERKVELSGELIALSSGNIYKKYFIRRYGNNRIIEAILELTKRVSYDVIPFGKILLTEDDTAIINIGKLQRVKLKDKFIILKSKEVVDHFYSNTPFKKDLIVGEAEVIKIDERIATVKLYKTHKVVFDLINANDIVMVKKEDKEAKDKEKEKKK